MVKEFRITKKTRINGKLCHFQKEDFIRWELTNYFWQKIEDINLDELKNKIVNILKSEGFVFYDDISYKYITHYGRLFEFAVNFKHII